MQCCQGHWLDSVVAPTACYAAPRETHSLTHAHPSQVAELGAFVVHPAYRRAGFGDSLLDYVEQVGLLVGCGGSL